MGQGRHTLKSISDPVYPVYKPVAVTANNASKHSQNSTYTQHSIETFNY